jgi:hypothetical protein
MDWTELGQNIGRNISSWFSTVDWELAGRSLHDGIAGLRETVLSAVESMDIDWDDILSAFGRGLLGKDHPTLAKLLFGDDESVSLTAEITGIRDGIPKNKRTLSDFVSQFKTWNTDFRSDPWAAMKGVFAGSNWAAESSFVPWAYVKGWLSSWGLSSGFAPWAYIKGWFSSWGLSSGFAPWSYIKGWFKSWDFASGWSPWSYIKGWFKNWDFASGWNPWSYIKGWFKAGGGVYAGGAWRPIQQYAAGGAPGGGQLFVAREAGPELVGTLGGHTAVMNNDQIVASVSAGVARAIAGVRFYSRDAATPHLAVIGQSAARGEEHLAALAKRAEAEAAGGGTAAVIVLLRQILEALTSMDLDVKLDGASVKDRVVQLVNAHTQATGVCEIVV